ncbi:hypothetical protein BOTBODRAFT_36623 [Botryobasidium botryosum FD-172 SS1]|uniref:Retrovirus-related Pol polyprotein from transposon TNT 1-94-like beta-barrel domain-containing protein n=1 Tax=Botryobasidium botryosum (strain FD-172 SS1) TaxID=930990 RepID=A0A067M5L2_BOTB1|nr:hypothetical protein BOTBODRAFT_36623 [Botryobasidium botryosum FD-172 SS1]
MHTPAQSLDIPNFARPPNLDVDGSNWYIYDIRMTLYLQAKGLYQHVETKLDPPDPHSYPSRHLEFKQRDATVKLIIASTVPDSLLIRVHDRPTAKGMWDALAQELGPKGAIFRAGFERALREKNWLGPKTVETLAQLREQLAGAGGIISHDDYFRRTLQSLYYCFSAGEKDRSDFVAEVEEDPIAKWVPGKHNLNTSIVSACGANLSDTDELRSADRDPGEIQGALVSRLRHRRTASLTMTAPAEPEMWTSLPLMFSRRLRTRLQPPEPPPQPPPLHPLPYPGRAVWHAPRNLFYQCTSPHLPHRHDFITFTPIEPKTFKSALGSTLIATAIGDLPIFVPEGDGEKPILLKNAYYAPKLAATLVSILQLSQEWEGDLSIDTDDGGVLTATSDEGVVVSIPPRDGLHQVTHRVSSHRIARLRRVAFEFRPV